MTLDPQCRRGMSRKPAIKRPIISISRDPTSTGTLNDLDGFPTFSNDVISIQTMPPKFRTHGEPKVPVRCFGISVALFAGTPRAETDRPLASFARKRAGKLAL